MKIYKLNEDLNNDMAWTVGNNFDDDGNDMWLMFSDDSQDRPTYLYFNLLNEPKKPAKFSEFKFDTAYCLDSDGDDFDFDGSLNIKDYKVPESVKSWFCNLYNDMYMLGELDKNSIIKRFNTAVAGHIQELEDEEEYEAAEEFRNWYQLVNVRRIGNVLTLTLDRPIADETDAETIIEYVIPKLKYVDYRIFGNFIEVTLLF